MSITLNGTTGVTTPGVTGLTTALTAANGGTGLTAPGANGNILTSNGTAWTSAAAPAGGVTSVATGNGLSGGTITTTGTLVVACPTFNSVGSYVWGRTPLQTSGTITSGSNYSAGTGNTQVSSANSRSSTNNLSGTWKLMSSGNTNGTACDYDVYSLYCRVS